MARLIKFQGKTIETGDWITGNIYFENNRFSPIDIKYYGRIFIDKVVDGQRVERLQVIPETVGQYTNVIGCDRKRIYERDIVANKIYRGEVYWNYDFSGWRVAAETELRLLDVPLDNSYVVVGHKYDELIHSSFHKETSNDCKDNKRKNQVRESCC